MNPNPWNVSQVTVTTTDGVEHAGPSAALYFDTAGQLSVVQVTKDNDKVTIPASNIATIVHL